MADPFIVAIFTKWAKKPIAHSPLTHDTKLDMDDGWIAVINATPCGRSTYVWDQRPKADGYGRWEYRNERNIEQLDGLWLPLKHARLFTRPCLVCFPEKNGEW